MERQGLDIDKNKSEFDLGSDENKTGFEEQSKIETKTKNANKVENDNQMQNEQLYLERHYPKDVREKTKHNVSEFHLGSQEDKTGLDELSKIETKTENASKVENDNQTPNEQLHLERNSPKDLRENANKNRSEFDHGSVADKTGFEEQSKIETKTENANKVENDNQTPNEQLRLERNCPKDVRDKANQTISEFDHESHEDKTGFEKQSKMEKKTENANKIEHHNQTPNEQLHLERTYPKDVSENAIQNMSEFDLGSDEDKTGFEEQSKIETKTENANKFQCDNQTENEQLPLKRNYPMDMREKAKQNISEFHFGSQEDKTGFEEQSKMEAKIENANKVENDNQTPNEQLYLERNSPNGVRENANQNIREFDHGSVADKTELEEQSKMETKTENANKVENDNQTPNEQLHLERTYPKDVSENAIQNMSEFDLGSDEDKTGFEEQSKIETKTENANKFQCDNQTENEQLRLERNYPMDMREKAKQNISEFHLGSQEDKTGFEEQSKMEAKIENANKVENDNQTPNEQLHLERNSPNGVRENANQNICEFDHGSVADKTDLEEQSKMETKTENANKVENDNQTPNEQLHLERKYPKNVSENANQNISEFDLGSDEDKSGFEEQSNIEIKTETANKSECDNQAENEQLHLERNYPMDMREKAKQNISEFHLGSQEGKTEFEEQSKMETKTENTKKVENDNQTPNKQLHLERNYPKNVTEIANQNLSEFDLGSHEDQTGFEEQSKMEKKTVNVNRVENDNQTPNEKLHLEIIYPKDVSKNANQNIRKFDLGSDKDEPGFEEQSKMETKTENANKSECDNKMKNEQLCLERNYPKDVRGNAKQNISEFSLGSVEDKTGLDEQKRKETKTENDNKVEICNQAPSEKLCLERKYRKDVREKSKQTGTENKNKLSKVLTILNLTGKHPRKISREEMHQITKSSLCDEQPKSHHDLAYYFIKKLAKYDYTARDFFLPKGEDQGSCTDACVSKSRHRQRMNRRQEGKNTLDVNAMDVVIAVFLCCDDICRQDLVSHMWSCRLAIPLFIQENAPPSPPFCYIWPLRNLAMRWETQIDGQLSVREGRLVNEAIRSIAFIRVGEIGISKSSLINSVISVTDKTHSIFFNRHSVGATKQRYLVDGMIDISWYFPTQTKASKSIDNFMDAVMFLNMHGNAFKFQSHLPALSKISNTIAVLCEVKELVGCRDMLQECLTDGNTVLIILTDDEIEETDDVVIDAFNESLHAYRDKLDVLEVADMQQAELVREIRSVIKRLSEGKSVCLTDALHTLKNITLDENNDAFSETKKQAQYISSILRATHYEKRKKTYVPLQDEPWKRWAIADKEKLRTANKKRNEDLDSYMTARDNTMTNSRLEQIKLLQDKGNMKLIEHFLTSVNASEEKRKLFLRWLKFEMDDLCREELNPVYDKYQKTMQRLAQANDDENQNGNSELDELDKEVALRSFGLEHILREMGQIYEASTLPGSKLLSIATEYDLPKLAAEILLDGYPFELLDGNVNSVAMQWVKDVLRAVADMLKKDDPKPLRIKAISTLGIQSSGKSTLLNTLFGCQYAVSAGRCTRGVFCQLIKVEETYTNELGIDYVLAIDTEGLRAPELSTSDQMVKHDNELSTFVIGLADVTVLNLMGENTTYLDELLPISVHAFMRMEMATDFKPKCVIVHQNVNKEDRHKLLQQGRKLEEKLNKMTAIVCKQERTDIKMFKSIIDFNVSEDVFHLPALLDGIQPMAPISTRYSEELNAFKQSLLIKDGRKYHKSLPFFIRNFENLWSAIKKDDFVYQFRNTVESEARRKLDDYWCDANWKFRQPIRDILSAGYVQIQNCTNLENLRKLVSSLQSDLKKEIEKEYKDQTCAFETFLNEADIMMQETMKKWADNMEKRFYDLRADLIRETLKELTEFVQDKQRQLLLKDDKIRYQKKLKKDIEKLVQSVKCPGSQPLTEGEIQNLFEKNWEVWKSHILDEHPWHESNIDIDNDAYNAIKCAFPASENVLCSYIHDRKISSYDLEDFKTENLSVLKKLFRRMTLASIKNKQQDLANKLFFAVKATLESRERTIRPYLQEDIEEIVKVAKDFFQSQTDTVLKEKDEVLLVIVVCGYASKRLEKLHEDYNILNRPEIVMEKEKDHYLRIFKAHYNEAETVNLQATECQELLKKGMLEKIKRTLPRNVVLAMRQNLFSLKSKSFFIQELLIELASSGKFQDFRTFIRHPERSIYLRIKQIVLEFAKKDDKPMETTLKTMFVTIKEEVNQALQKSFVSGKDNFKTWLEVFRKEANDLIVLENIDRLQELGKGRAVNVEMFYKRLMPTLEVIIEDISRDVNSYLQERSLRRQIAAEIMATIIGCTESCPFCGAICLSAHAGHQDDHYTTLHRPQGCKSWHKKTSKILVTKSCPMYVASQSARFIHHEDKAEISYYYKDYKTVYPTWRITADETGEETSFWNWFFAEYAKQIAIADGLEIPEIPLLWKNLDRQSEINKLKEKLK